MKTLQKYKNEQMKNPEFAKAYEEIQPEMNVIRAIVDARALRNMTQKELSEKTGIAQTEMGQETPVSNCCKDLQMEWTWY